MIEVAESLLTEEFIVRIYEYLTVTRVKELVGWGTDLAEGQRDGYLSCLEDLFGLADDEEAEEAYDDKRSITHVIDRIVATLSPEIDPYIKKSRDDDFEIEEWLECVKIAKAKVREFAIDNFEDCVQGIRTM